MAAGHPLIAECRLDTTGQLTQSERYRDLGRFVERIERSDRELSVEFADGVDARLVQEAIAVERSCCPFFALHHEDPGRLLRVSVADSHHEPALDALVFALGGSENS